MIARLARRSNQMLIPLNWLEGMKISVTFYLLQAHQLVKKIDGLLTLDVHSISVLIGDVLLIHFGSRGRGFHGEFCYE